jgi:hypothetical protein
LVEHGQIDLVKPNVGLIWHNSNIINNEFKNYFFFILKSKLFELEEIKKPETFVSGFLLRRKREYSMIPKGESYNINPNQK